MDTRGPEKQPFMDIPPVAGEQRQEVVPEGPIKQAGTERNPELLPQEDNQAGPVSPQSQPADNAAGAVALSGAGQPAAATNQPTSTAAHDLPQIADDLDLIEKEWIEKAKDIVNKTKGNPHTQNRELNKMKAEYIRQRFNKRLQAEDEA